MATKQAVTANASDRFLSSDLATDTEFVTARTRALG